MKVFVLLLTCFFFAPEIFASEHLNLMAQNSQKKRKKRRRANQEQNVDTESLKKNVNEQDAAEAIVEEVKSAFFPDWQPMGFDWGIRPILGLQYTKVTGENGGSDQVATEAGLAGYLTGIPVVPGNAGFYLSPQVGKAWGSVDYKLSGATKTESVKYSRTYGGVDMTLYAGFYRHVFGVMRGVKEFSVKSYDKVQSMTITNDFGVLVLGWFSTHLTHTYLKGFVEKYSDPFLNEQDYWLHARMFTNVLSAYFDLGPGFTMTEEYSSASGSRTKVADGQIQYLKAVTGLHLFWKISATGHAKYIYQADDKALGNYAQTTLPEQGLNEPRQPTMPEDSLTASAFFGIKNLVAGFGLGWQYNLQVLNWSEKDGREKVTTKDNGFIFTYTASF